jgi:glutathione S-transferase
MSDVVRIFGTPKLILFHAEWCEFSAIVRRELEKTGLRYEAREVPMERELRGDLVAHTGDASIPALLVDGDPVCGAPAIVRRVRELAAGNHGGDPDTVAA